MTALRRIPSLLLMAAIGFAALPAGSPALADDYP